MLIATVDGRVAGLAATHVMSLVEHDELVCALIALVVRMEHRRRGIGTELVCAAEREARAGGCYGVVVGSARHRTDAHAFYR